jgi:Flp pilus assembly protein TadD
LRAMAHYDAAHAAAEAGRADDTIAHLREALWLAPDWLGARNELGLALTSRGRSLEAIAEFHEVIRTQPDAAAAHNGLAIALENAGRTDEAIAEYREAVRLAPTEPRARLNLAAILTGRGRIDDAILEYREVLRLAPDLPEAHVGLGDAFVRQGRARDAAAAYRAALLARPSWRPALLSLAWLLATTDDPEVHDPPEALSLALQAAHDDGADDVAALRTLAVSYASNRRFEEAAATAERAHQIARAAGEDDLARELGERAAAYRTGRAAP